MDSNVLTVVVMEGEGIGPEIFKYALPYLSRVAEHHGKTIDFIPAKLGTQHGNTIPPETLALLQQYPGLKGPTGTPIGKGHQSFNVQLRQSLDLYTCKRPVSYYTGVPSPIKHPEKVDIVVFRENTEDIYAGIEIQKASANQLQLLESVFEMKGRFNRDYENNFSLKPISKQGSERIIRAAIEYALENNLPSVTIVHKGNIMKATEGAFLEYGYDLAEIIYGDRVYTQRQYDTKKKTLEELHGKGSDDAKQQLVAWETAQKDAGLLFVNALITDNAFQQVILHPEHYHVMVTMNLNGDYISDALAALVGGIGIAPGANINYETGLAVYEATHGTAPDIAGKDMANPSSLLLSAAMLFRDKGWRDVADSIEEGLSQLYSERRFTADFAIAYKAETGEDIHPLSTPEFMHELQMLLQSTTTV